MKVAAIQMRNYAGRRSAAYAAAELMISSAAAKGAELAVLPELSSCGYIPNERIWNYCESSSGETARWACEMAEHYSIYVGAGYLETDGMDFYDAYLIASPGGKVIGRIHGINPSSYCFKPSDIGSIIDTRLGRIAIGICADTHKKWFFKRLASLDFDLIIMPHAWATPYAEGKNISRKNIDTVARNLHTLGALYAKGFGVPVIFVNAVGDVPPMRGLLGKFMTPDCYRLRGGSSILLPDCSGVYARSEREELVMAEITPQKARGIPIKPSVYSGWLYPGSFATRKVIMPLDRINGGRYYRRHHRKNR